MKNYTITAGQLLLLKAATFPPDAAFAYWQSWLNRCTIDPSDASYPQLLRKLIGTIDRDSQRLMPLIYRNLKATSGAFVSPLDGIYRASWVKNQKHLIQLQTLLNALQQEGIDAIMLKGMSMAIRYYSDMGVRMTSDVDVLVPTDVAEKALTVLQSPMIGLKATKYESKHRKILHAIHLFDPRGLDVDLHWNLLFYHAYPGADAPFWAAKQPIKLPNGTIGHTLSATHQVFHNLVHGFHWGGPPAIRWVPDTLIICRDTKVVDWHELIDLSEQYQMRIPIRQGLHLLMAEFGLILPDSARHRLDTLSVSTNENAFFSLFEQPAISLLSKSIRFMRRHQLAYRLFRSGKPDLSFSQFVLRSIHFRLEWHKRDLPY